MRTGTARCDGSGPAAPRTKTLAERKEPKVETPRTLPSTRLARSGDLGAADQGRLLQLHAVLPHAVARARDPGVVIVSALTVFPAGRQLLAECVDLQAKIDVTLQTVSHPKAVFCFACWVVCVLGGGRRYMGKKTHVGRGADCDETRRNRRSTADLPRKLPLGPLGSLEG